jgi:lysophospholipase L1-like esterase
MSDYDTTQIGDYDIYTIELGVNDWSNTHLTPVGSLNDYKNADGTQNSNYAQCLKRMILKIRSVSSNPTIILFTPRRAYGMSGFLPASSNDANNDGIYLHEYADLLIEVAKYEGFMVVDMFYNSGINDDNLTEYSYDTALHPNEKGMQQYANMLYDVLRPFLYNV